MFPRRRLWLTWNTRYAGQQAFRTLDSHGYKISRIFDRKYYAHRVVMALASGEWPDEVDHIDGNRANNAIENLRAVSHKGNQRNTKRPSNNKSGVIGVYWNSARELWTAQIHVDGKGIHIGDFRSIEHAKSARKLAELKHGFHPNHGRAA